MPAALAARTACVTSRVLPMPDSPRRSSARLSACGAATSSLSRASSSSRPTRAAASKTSLQVLLARADAVRQVGCTDALVAGDHGLRVEGGDLVEAGDPCLAAALVGLCGHHVHAVVDDVAADHEGDRGYVQNSGVFGVALADRDRAQRLALELELAAGQGLWQHGLGGQLAREAALPVGRQAGVGRLELGTLDDLRGRDALRVREVFLQLGQA